MDTASKILILMVLIALLVGTAVRLFNKNFTQEKIYESNRNYFPSITEKGILGR
jgi:hypothetical protein